MTAPPWPQYGLLLRPRRGRGRPRFTDDALLRDIAAVYNAAAVRPAIAVQNWLTIQSGKDGPYPERTARLHIHRARDAGYITHRHPGGRPHKSAAATH